MAGSLRKPVSRAEPGSAEPDRGSGPGPGRSVAGPGSGRPVPEPGPSRSIPGPGSGRPARPSPADRPAGRAGTTARPGARSPPPPARPPGPPPRPVPPRPRTCSRPHHSIITILNAHTAPHTIITPITTKRATHLLGINIFRHHNPTRKMSNRKNRSSPNCKVT